MKKQFKKITSLILIISLLCSSMLSFGALAAGGSLKLTLSSDKTIYKAGDTIVLTVTTLDFVNITNGIAGFTMNLSYDNTKFDYVAGSETVLQPQNPGALSVNNQANNLVIVLADATELPMLFMAEGNLISLSFIAKTDITSSIYNFTLGTYNSVTEDFVDNAGLISVTYPVPLAVIISTGTQPALALLGTSAFHLVEDEYVYGISESTTLSAVKTNFANSEYITITGAFGNIVGTGCMIKLIVNSKIIDTLTVVIKGDISGNGVIGLEDLTQIRDHLLEITPLTSSAYLAGNIYNEASITLNDLVGIMADVSEVSNINQNSV